MKFKNISALLGIGGAFALFELFYRTRDKYPCIMLPELRTQWRIENIDDNRRVYRCMIPIRNFNRKFEATVVDVKPSVRVLAKGLLPEDIQVNVSVKPLNKEARDDGYWPAYILTPQTTLDFELTIDVTGDIERIDEIHALKVRLDYEIYSRRSKEGHSEEIVLIPNQDVKAKLAPITTDEVIIFPIKTHVLSDTDNMSAVVQKYVSPIAEEGDIVVMAESVVAITQRRYRSPEDVKPGFWASRLCYLIPNVGSLSSRYGMQTAIDEVGLPRMLAAVAGGATMKLMGKKGWLYTIAGLPSELIDDVTGTMAPYDKYIVMGPHQPQAVVDNVKIQTGLDAVIADVNDIKRAKILAATDGVNPVELQKHLLDNPLGNASEQTPVLLIRSKVPSKLKQTESKV